MQIDYGREKFETLSKSNSALSYNAMHEFNCSKIMINLRVTDWKKKQTKKTTLTLTQRLQLAW